MGYTWGGLGNNEHGFVAPINPVVHTSRTVLGYDLAAAPSPTSNYEVLEENSHVDYDKQIKDMVANVVPNDSIVALKSKSVEEKTEASSHPHKKKLPKNQHYWWISSPTFRSLQKRHERMNRGPVSTIKIVCGWINGWSWFHLNQCLKTSYCHAASIVHCWLPFFPQLCFKGGDLLAMKTIDSPSFQNCVLGGLVRWWQVFLFFLCWQLSSFVFDQCDGDNVQKPSRVFLYDIWVKFVILVRPHCLFVGWWCCFCLKPLCWFFTNT